MAQAGHQHVERLFGRHLDPVGGPEVSAEDADAAPIQPDVELRRVGKAGIAEEGHARLRSGAAIGGHVIGLKAPLDVGARSGIAKAGHGHGRVAEAVVANRVALAEFALHQVRRCLGVAPDEEEGCLDAFMGEGVEHGARRGGQGAIVECQDDFAFFEGEGLGVGLLADAQVVLRRDLDGAGGAQGIRVAGAGLGHGQGAKRRHEQGGEKQAVHGTFRVSRAVVFYPVSTEISPFALPNGRG